MMHILVPVVAVFVAAPAPAAAQAQAFTRADFDRLSFMEGRWAGHGPDGQPIFASYKRHDRNTFRSTGYADDRFLTAIHPGAVEFENGEIVVRWEANSWRATRIEDGYAEFEPISAPASFSWRKISTDEVELVQRWTEASLPQSFTIILRRAD